jgi:hypothetical protein
MGANVADYLLGDSSVGKRGFIPTKQTRDLQPLLVIALLETLPHVLARSDQRLTQAHTSA